MSDDDSTKPLRIVHCFREPTGGLFRHVRDLIRIQAADGHQIGIVCDATTGSPREDALLEELRPQLALGIHRIAMQRHIGFGDAKAAYKAYRIIKKLQPDILHGHGAKGGVYARLFGSVLRVFKSRVARIYSPHGGSLHFDGKTRKGRIIFLVEKMLTPLCDAILFVSNFEKRTYEEKIGRPYDLHAIIYNGLSNEEFIHTPLAVDATDLLFVGTMRDLKGPDLLIRALADLRDNHRIRLTLTMIGDGAEKQNFVTLSDSLNLSDQVRFLPGMAAREAFTRGRIMVIPSRAEALPYIVLEALAAGKTVISSNVGGIPEIFGSNSLALTQPDVYHLKEKLLSVTRDEISFHALMPDASRLHERFSLNAMTQSIELVYREARS